MLFRSGGAHGAPAPPGVRVCLVRDLGGRAGGQQVAGAPAAMGGGVVARRPRAPDIAHAVVGGRHAGRGGGRGWRRACQSQADRGAGSCRLGLVLGAIVPRGSRQQPGLADRDGAAAVPRERHRGHVLGRSGRARAARPRAALSRDPLCLDSGRSGRDQPIALGRRVCAPAVRRRGRRCRALAVDRGGGCRFHGLRAGRGRLRRRSAARVHGGTRGRGRVAAAREREDAGGQQHGKGEGFGIHRRHSTVSG